MSNFFAYSVPFEDGLVYYKNRFDINNELSGFYLRNFDFSKGKFYSVVSSKKINKEYWLMFDRAGIYFDPNRDVKAKHTFPEKGNNERLSILIQHILLNDTSLCCGFEDVLHERRDKFEDELSDKVFYFGEEVYIILSRETPNREILESAIYDADAQWHFLCTVSSFDPRCLSNQQITSRQIKDLALASRVIFLNCYDGEGYLMWTTIDLSLIPEDILIVIE